MKKYTILLVWAVFCTQSLFAQSWTDSLSMNIRTNAANPGQVTATTFRLWIPATTTDVKALLLVSARGVGYNNGADGSGIYGRANEFKFALHPMVRKMASETNTAILCIQGATDAGLVIDFDPTIGHADSLLKMIGYLATRNEHPEMNFVPFLAFGHSLGSIFAQNIALWNPQRVAATILYQTGGFVGQPSWTSSFNPGMTLQDVPTLLTSGECEGPDINNNAGGFYADATFTRAKAERVALRPFHQIIRRNGSHSILMPLEAEMMTAFLRKAIQYRIPASQSPATSPVVLSLVNQSAGWLGNLTSFKSFDPSVTPWNATDAPNRFWLFDEEYANQWKKYHTAPIAFTLSRQGPFCANDTFTVFWTCPTPVSFGPHNQFRLEMSSVRGDFDSYSFPIRIVGNISSSQQSGSFKAIIPDNLQRIQQIGANTPLRYRFRLVSTQPVMESNNNGEQDISFCSGQPYNLYSYLQNGGVPLQYCAGTTDSLTLVVGRLPSFSLNAVNELQVQLSDSLGMFTNPLVLRTITSQITSGGSTPNVAVKIGWPSSVLPGKKYRLRAVSTHPVAVSSTCGSDLAIVASQTALLQTNGELVSPYGSRYQWLRNDQPVPGAIFQTYSPDSQGSYRCLVYNGNCENTSNPVVLTSVSPHSLPKSEMRLYPNPGEDRIRILVPDSEPVLSVQVFNMNGKSMETDSFQDRLEISVKNFLPGLYTIRVATKTSVYTRMLVKK